MRCDERRPCQPIGERCGAAPAPAKPLSCFSICPWQEGFTVQQTFASQSYCSRYGVNEQLQDAEDSAADSGTLPANPAGLRGQPGFHVVDHLPQPGLDCFLHPGLVLPDFQRFNGLAR